MSTYLYRLGRFAAKHRWFVIGLWLVVAIGGGSLASALGGQLQSSFEIPGTQSQSALDALQQRFPQLSGASGRVILVAPPGSDVSASQSAVTATCESLAAIPEVALATCPFPMPATGTSPAGSAAPSQIAADGSMAFVSLQLTVAATGIDDALVGAVEAAAQPARDAGLQTAYSGLVATEASGVDWTEIAGLAIAFVVLALTFGSFLAAGVPLVTAVIGVGVASSSILVVAAFAPVSSTAPLLATMLGLAVGIDYALLIVSRHRAQLAEGMEIRESVAVATATAGTAVVFAGGTVMIALLGLAVAGIPFLTVMGVGAAAAVLCALAVAITLIPAVLSLLGGGLRTRAQRRALRATRRGDATRRVAPVAHGESRLPGDAGRRRGTGGWVRVVTRVPLATVAIVVVALLALAVPAASLRLTLPDAGYDPPTSPARIAYDLLDSGFGPGFNGPLLVTADISGTLDIPGALDALDGAFGSLPDVAAVSQAVPNQALDLAVLSITPKSAPSSDETTALVQQLRADAPAFQAAHGFGYQVTGQTALAIDISDRLGQALLPFAIVVVGLCLLLLAIMFRSLAVPITATLGYLLTVAAALGVSTAVFEWGWGAGLIGVTKVGPVISFMPILVMAVLFGLAMDYHVFLVSRMRERFAETGDARRAVHEGFRASAKVVTAAALIMFAVFFSFVPGGNTIIQPIALALAVGVLVDAFVVRMTLVPALMALLGERAWWLPRWLERVLPNADIEGEEVQRMLAQRERRGADSSRGIAATGLVVHGSAPLDLRAEPGAVVLLRGAADGHGDVAAGVLATLAGRAVPAAGDLAVQGRLIPFDRAAVARATAYVPARPDGVDGQSVAERLRTLLRLAGVRRRERGIRLQRAAEAFDALVGAGGAGIVPGTPVASLDEAQRWSVEAAGALASSLPGLALDLREQHDPARALAIVVQHADLGTTVVAVTDVAAPTTDRTVVEVEVEVEVEVAVAAAEGVLR